MTVNLFDLGKVLATKFTKPENLVRSILTHPGDSFLIGYNELLRGSYRTSVAEVRVYLFLAGSRSYAKYLRTGELTLPLELSPLSSKMLDNNGLIKIKHNKVFFKFEEERK